MSQPAAAAVLEPLRRVLDGTADPDDWHDAHPAVGIIERLAAPGIIDRIDGRCPLCGTKLASETSSDVEIARLHKRIRDLKAELAEARSR